MTGVDALGSVRALICEDEPLARRAIRDYLSDVAWVEIVGEATNGPEALRLIHKLEPDVVFLDVRMPGMSGIEVLDALTVHPAIVFTTAFDEYAVSAFDHGAVDYLIKPFGRDRLVQTLDRIRVRLRGVSGAGLGGHSGAVQAPVPGAAATGARAPGAAAPGVAYPERIFARHRGTMVPVAVAEIRRVDAVDGGVEIRLAGRTLHLDVSLGEMEGRLDPRDFVRVHRAHVVNLTHVRGVRRYDERRYIVTLEDGSTIVASRSGSQTLREHMG